MERGVPLALLGVVQLAATAAWVGLAVAAVTPRLRRRSSVLLVLGALLLAVADVVTAVRFGQPASDVLAVTRAAGLLLAAAGLSRGAAQPVVVQVPAVVVPLGAGAVPAAAGAVAGGLAAAAAALRSLGSGADRRVGLSLATAFALTGVAAALAVPAQTSYAAAVAVLVLRGLAAVAVLAALGRLASASLVTKLTGAIVAGVVAMAAGAVGVVGPSVASEVQSQQSERLRTELSTQLAGLDRLGAELALPAQIATACVDRADHCAPFFGQFSSLPGWFAAVVAPGQGISLLAADTGVSLTASALQQLAGAQVVRELLDRRAALPRPGALNARLVLSGRASRLAVVDVAPGYTAGQVPGAFTKPAFAAVFGVLVSDRYLQSTDGASPYRVTILSDDAVLGSSFPDTGPRGGTRGVALVRDEVRAHQPPPTASVGPPVVVGSAGTRPVVAFAPVTAVDNADESIATMAVSLSANAALSAQRHVVTRLFVAALLIVALVALLAVLLARRIADPVRRLTAAANRVRGGDLSAATPAAGQDEVSSLSRAFAAMTASLQSVTHELKATAAEEAAVRGRLEAVLGAMTDGVVVTDREGQVTGLNPAAAVILGVDPDLQGVPLADVAEIRDGEGRPLLPPRSAHLTADGVVTRAGGDVPVRMGVAPLDDGRGLVLVLTDMTRERQVERMKTEFLSNVSHELRTPLTPIRGYVELLQRRRDLSPEQVAAYLDVIHGSAIGMNRVVDLLVDVAALEAGRVVLERHPVPVDEWLEQRLVGWRTRFAGRAGDLRRDVPPRLPSVDIDPQWIGKALDELVDNAVKHTPAGSPVTVFAATAGARVRVGVRDAGPGIDPERVPALLDDFSQADASETRRVGGMGLGLSFVRRLADAFGIPFVVHSTPGHGCEFALDLGAVAAQPPGSSRRRRAAADTSGR